jgi:hypothetical protein
MNDTTEVPIGDMSGAGLGRVKTLERQELGERSSSPVPICWAIGHKKVENRGAVKTRFPSVNALS